MGEEKQKKIPENAEDCKLHFVRCIKPRPKPLNKEDQPGLFVHSMTLQQITYMGVMESVALKQKNFPFRKKFEEFYSEFELLSPRYAQKRYYQMDKGSEDFQKLACDIVIESMQGCGKEYYALGTTKILMMPEARTVIEECMKKAAEKRDKAAAVLKRAYSFLMAPPIFEKKADACLSVQCRYKLKYRKRQVRYAE
jgi:myosin heavy subunit